MISTKRFLVLALATGFTVASAVTGEAQIIYPFPPAYRYAYADASVRLEVTPKQAEVYVDGYYAGIVDDFDGVFQRLRTQPGRHDITLYMDGFHTVHQNVFLMPDKTLDIRQRMEPLAPGEVNEARPVPMTPEEPQPGTQPMPFPRGRGGRAGQFPPGNQPPPPPRNQPQGGNGPGAQAATGTLSIDLQPADADVMLDGQPLSIPRGQGPLVIDLSEGRHVVQARKQGYVGYLTEVQVRRGEMATLDINLRPQP